MKNAGKWKVWLSSVLLGTMLLADLPSAAQIPSVSEEAAVDTAILSETTSLVTDDGTIRKQEVRNYSSAPATVDFGEIEEAPYLVQTDLQLSKGQTDYLKISSNEPYTAQFVSSNPAVAAVDANGKVTAKKLGSCQIKVKINDEWFSCSVQVKKIAFKLDRISIARNRKTKLELTDPSLKKVQWRSTNKKVATVTKKGILQGKHAGTCRIIATARGASCSLKVTVEKTNAKNLQETYDKTKKTNRKKLMLIGSSSVDFWKSSAKAFAPYDVINMGIAGSKTTHWLKYYEELVTDYKPCAVVIYVGSNDIRRGKSVPGKVNAANSIELIRRIHEKLPDIPVFYVGICHVWSRVGGWKEVDASNADMKAYCDSQSDVYYIDLASHMLDKKGLPRKSLYRKDLIHPNAKGYKVWDKYIAKRVVKIMRKKK